MMDQNTSGHGDFAQVPEEIKKWNWGAFWLSGIWGIFNKSYIALLILLPIINFIVPFYLGAKGNELAWRNKQWKDIKEFKEEQKVWSIAGWIFAGVLIICLAVSLFNVYRIDQITDSVTKQVVSILYENEEAKKLIGDKPIVAVEPSIQSVTTSDGTFPIGHTMMFNGIGGIVWVNTTLSKNYEIESITITPPNDNNSKFFIEID